MLVSQPQLGQQRRDSLFREFHILLQNILFLKIRY